MRGDSIPADVRAFILKYIGSIAKLEALLLLRRDPQGAWTASAAAQRLYVPSEAAAELLQQLRTEGFLVQNGDTYRYECRTVELQQGVDRLADVYAHQLIPVTNLVHSIQSPLREFSDAFRLRKDT